jgi:hypothetical protein
VPPENAKANCSGRHHHSHFEAVIDFQFSYIFPPVPKNQLCSEVILFFPASLKTKKQTPIDAAKQQFNFNTPTYRFIASKPFACIGPYNLYPVL